MPQIFKRLIKTIKSNPNIDIIIIFFFSLTVYIHNLSPGVFGTDSGDFLTASITRGVPHPSGYPLYTLLGILFLALPFTATAAWKMGLISAIFSSFSVVLMYKIVKSLTEKRYLAVLTSLTLAFTYPFWLYAEVIEVFSLHYFFILLLSFLAIKFKKTRKRSVLLYLAFFTGLSLTNNQTIILTFPAIAFLILVTDYKVIFDYKLLMKAILLFILGLTPYIYIPLAASTYPFINWGRVVTFKNFQDFVLRKQYGWGIKTDIPLNPKDAFPIYYFYWRDFIGPIIPVFSLIGSVYLIVKKKYKLFIFFLISFLTLGPLFVLWGTRRFYVSLNSVATRERFYIQSIIISFLPFVYGFIALSDSIKKGLQKNRYKEKITNIFLATMLVIPITSFVANFSRTNLSDVFIGDNLGYDLLSPLPARSVVLFQDDNFAFNTLSVQVTSNFRTDIYIPGRHDGLYGILKASGMNEDEIREYSINFGGAIENNLFYKALPYLVTNFDIYSDFTLTSVEIYDDLYGKVIFVPQGLLYKAYFEKTFDLSKEEYLLEVDNLTTNLHLEELRKHEVVLDYNIVYADIKGEYANAFYAIAEFLAGYYQDKDAALVYLKKALELDPLAKAAN